MVEIPNELSCTCELCFLSAVRKRRIFVVLSKVLLLLNRQQQSFSPSSMSEVDPQDLTDFFFYKSSWLESIQSAGQPVNFRLIVKIVFIGEIKVKKEEKELQPGETVFLTSCKRKSKTLHLINLLQTQCITDHDNYRKTEWGQFIHFEKYFHYPNLSICFSPLTCIKMPIVI